MNHNHGAYWSRYDELPPGKRMEHRFTEFWRFAELIDLHSFDISFLHIHPDEHGPMHAHEPPIEEIYFILDGPLDIDINDDTIRGNTDMVFYFPPDVTHRPINRYDTPGRLLSIRSLANGDSNFTPDNGP